MRVAVAMVALLAMLAAPRPSDAKIFPPVIRIGPLCAPACANLTTNFAYTCVQCLVGAGWVPVWTNASQPAYTLARMPFFELGLKSVVALPFNAPGPWTSFNMGMVAWNARKVYPDLPKNITVWYIDAAGNNVSETRNMGPTLVRRNNNNTGYCHEGSGWINYDPPCDGHVDPLSNISFNSPEQYAMSGYATQRRFDEYIPTMVKYSNELLHDVDVAADSLWAMNQIVWSDTLYFQAIGESDLPEMQMRFGADWTSELTEKLRAGKLIKMDMSTWMENLTVDLGNRMQPGSLSIHERTKDKTGRFVARAVLLLLSDPGSKRQPPRVYSPQKSATAWCLAMIYARTALNFHQIRIGHFYTFHMMAAAQHYALVNSIEPGVPQGKATHPIRQLLDEWCDVMIQGSIELGTYLGATTPPYVAIKPPTYPQMHNMFVQHGPLGGDEPMDMWGVHPRSLERRSKLNASDYTSPGGEKWDLYEHMWFSTNLYEHVYRYNLRVVKAFYDSDADVRKDKDVMNFIEFLQSPVGANMGRINEHNKVTTREELADVTANIMYKSVVHAFLHLQDYFKRSLNIIAAPTRIDNPILPDPTKTWSVTDMMALMPNMRSVAEQLFQGFNIIMVSPQGGPWIPRKPGTNEPDWTGALPFPDRGSRNKKANEHAVAFRKKIADWIVSMKVDGWLRQTDTNYNQPFEITTHIDF